MNHSGEAVLEGKDGDLEKLWSRDYIFDIGINFLIYVVHFQLMLWSTSYAIHMWQVSIGTAGLASGIFIVGALFARIPAGRFIDFAGICFWLERRCFSSWYCFIVWHRPSKSLCL